MSGLMDGLNKAVSKIQEGAKDLLDKTDIDEFDVEPLKEFLVLGVAVAFECICECKFVCLFLPFHFIILCL